MQGGGGVLIERFLKDSERKVNIGCRVRFALFAIYSGIFVLYLLGMLDEFLETVLLS